MSRRIDPAEAICLRPNGPHWEAIPGDKPAGEIIRTGDLADLVDWLRATYPREPLVILPRLA